MTAVETKGIALITGASTGIGAVYANRLARRGYDLILVARNSQRLAAQARRIVNETGRAVETISADLSDRAGSIVSKTCFARTSISRCSSTMPVSAPQGRCWGRTSTRWKT